MKVAFFLVVLDFSLGYAFQPFNFSPLEMIRHIPSMFHMHGDTAPTMEPSEFLEATDLNNTLTVLEMIEKEGFEGQEHNVTTRDGFILTLHRVTKSSNEIVPTKRPAAVVFIQHGLLCSAAEWVIGSRENSLAFLLANEGYDVWLGNFRGNIYSRSHKTLNATDAQFWDFSWDEMAKYDLPSMLNYTLNVTRQNSLIYVGHSMGTTALFAMSTLYPKYAHKVVKAAVLLAPVAAIPNMSSPLRFLFSPLSLIMRSLGLNQVLPPKNYLHLLSLYICKHGDNPLCEAATASTMFFLSGFNWPNLNCTLIPFIAGHSPAGTSSHTVLHFAQLYKTKGFHSYDGGPEHNLRKHGSKDPIKYQVKKAQFPTAVYWSDHDWFATPEDVKHSVLKHLPNVIDAAQVPAKMFNHVDFLYANHIKSVLYDRVVSTINKFR